MSKNYVIGQDSDFGLRSAVKHTSVDDFHSRANYTVLVRGESFATAGSHKRQVCWIPYSRTKIYAARMQSIDNARGSSKATERRQMQVRGAGSYRSIDIYRPRPSCSKPAANRCYGY